MIMSIFDLLGMRLDNQSPLLGQILPILPLRLYVCLCKDCVYFCHLCKSVNNLCLISNPTWQKTEKTQQKRADVRYRHGKWAAGTFNTHISLRKSYTGRTRSCMENGNCPDVVLYLPSLNIKHNWHFGEVPAIILKAATATKQSKWLYIRMKHNIH